MDKLPNLQKDISDLVSILSFITRRVEDPGQSTDEDRISEPPGSQEHGDGLDTTDESVDEVEFEPPIIPEEEAIKYIKCNALDRLAEVLAKFKTAKGHKTSDDPSRDAKHVTSVMMAENLMENTATFFCAKNEGLDTDDVQFLRNLERLYQGMATKGKPKLFLLVFKDARRAVPRTTTLTSENLQLGRRRCTRRSWTDNNDFDFEIPIVGTGEDSLSDIAVDLLSDREDENLVQDVFHDILRHFRDFDTVPQLAMKGLLRNLYSIVRHPRRRPALKGLLRQVLHGRFKKAWSSLLFLTRIFYAAVAFEQLASKSGFTSIQFKKVPSPTPYMPKHSVGKSPNQILRSLGNRDLPNWGDFFSRQDKVKEFIKTSRKKKPIHAEVQLITYILQLAQTSTELGGEVFPYIGCSKKLCFSCTVICNLSPVGNKQLQFRGSHWTVFSLWALPISISQPLVDSLHQFPILLRTLLQRFLAAPQPPQQRDLLQQSSAALSTAKAVAKTPPAYTTRPQISRRIMRGGAEIIATNQQMEFVPSPGNPGYANVPGGNTKYRTNEEVPIYEAEVALINNTRRNDGLEDMDEMPPTKSLDQRKCRRCGALADYRCRICWTFYCSSDCKKRHSAAHVFTCAVPNRPNELDFLRLAIRKVGKEIQSEEEERIHDALIYIFADDHICRTFGFVNCGNILEVLQLICLYATVLCRVRPAVQALQEHLEADNLGQFLTSFCELERNATGLANIKECSCVTWFLERWAPESFPIPSRDKEVYDIWIVAMNCAFESLGISQRVEKEDQLSQSEREVADLYIAIQPTIWRLPDVTSPSWIRFGFCHCKSFDQRLQLSKHYLSLASSGATFGEIVSAYESSSLPDLMRAHAIDISALERQGILPRHPDACEFTTLRLRVGVEHALSGRFCDCFRVHESRVCCRVFETHLDRECDTNFGFHLTSSWEKWQLMNFYKYIFRQENYDTRRMAEAMEDADHDALEAYLETLDPGMRKRLHFGNRGNIMFPRLKDRMEMRSTDGTVIHRHLACECKLHDVIGPPGLSLWSLQSMLDALGFFGEDNHPEISG